TGKELGRLKAHPLPDRASLRGRVLLSPDGRTVIASYLPLGFTGGGDGLLYFFDLASGKEKMRIGEQNTVSPDATPLADVNAISPNGSLLATSVEYQHRLVLWDTRTGKPVRQMKTPDYVRDLAFSPDGRTLASVHMRTRSVYLWESATGRERARLPHELSEHEALCWVTFAPDGRRLASMSEEGKIWLWDLSKQRILHTLPGAPG